MSLPDHQLGHLKGGIAEAKAEFESWVDCPLIEPLVIDRQSFREDRAGV
jgi:hypothetical protein